MLAPDFVVNVDTGAKYGVLIDRTTFWGNPFQIGVDGTREEVCVLYELTLQNRPNLVERIKQELKGKILGCHCVPQLCHGHIIARIANGL